MGNDSQAAWLQWWIQGFWQQTDESWQDHAFFSLTPEQQQCLAKQYAWALCRTFEVPIAFPPPLTPLRLSIQTLPMAAQPTMLALVAEICRTGTQSNPLLPEQKIWCRRIAKGLRTGHWLPPTLFTDATTTDSLLLLRLLLPECWPRLRLRFPRSQVIESEIKTANIPGNKLLPLWEAVLWQCQYNERTPNVDNEEDHTV